MYFTEFKLRPTDLIDHALVETYCTVNICNTEDCENQKEIHNITIPVKDGFFPEIDNGRLESNSVSWLAQGTRRGTISVELENSKKVNTG